MSKRKRISKRKEQIKRIVEKMKLGLYNKMLVKIDEAGKEIKGNSQQDYIPFPIVFAKLGRCFTLKRVEIWEYLKILEELNFLKIESKGVKLGYGVKE